MPTGGHKGTFWDAEILYILIEMVFRQEHVHYRYYKVVRELLMNFIACKLNFSKAHIEMFILQRP